MYYISVIVYVYKTLVWFSIMAGKTFKGSLHETVFIQVPNQALVRIEAIFYWLNIGTYFLRLIPNNLKDWTHDAKWNIFYCLFGPVILHSQQQAYYVP